MRFIHWIEVHPSQALVRWPLATVSQDTTISGPGKQCQILRASSVRLAQILCLAHMEGKQAWKVILRSIYPPLHYWNSKMVLEDKGEQFLLVMRIKICVLISVGGFQWLLCKLPLQDLRYWMCMLWCSPSTAFFLMFIFSTYSCPDNHYAEGLGVLKGCTLCLHR